MGSPTLQATILAFILQEWGSLAAPQRPVALWIREYAPVVDSTTGIDPTQLPRAVWFADSHTVHPRSIWAWQRLYTVHFVRPWCWLHSPSGNQAPFGTRYELGLAAFAPLIEHTDVYVETIWGGLFARGWQLALNDQQQITNRRLRWVA